MNLLQLMTMLRCVKMSSLLPVFMFVNIFCLLLFVLRSFDWDLSKLTSGPFSRWPSQSRKMTEFLVFGFWFQLKWAFSKAISFSNSHILDLSCIVVFGLLIILWWQVNKIKEKRFVLQTITHTKVDNNKMKIKPKITDNFEGERQNERSGDRLKKKWRRAICNLFLKHFHR